MEIIPAIDIIDGKCVRLSQGDYSRMKTYSADPVSVAKRFEDNGIRRLHLVDLDGARASHIVNLKVLEKISSGTRLIIDFGGGVKTDQDVSAAFNAGAHMITGGSIAVKQPPVFETWLFRFGADRIILGADVKDEKITVGGWTEDSDHDIMEFIRFYAELSVKYVICTDVSRDGVLTGPAIDLYTKILELFPGIRLIASGGISSVEDLENLVQAGVWGAIIGKAIYEGRISLENLKRFL